MTLSFRTALFHRRTTLVLAHQRLGIRNQRVPSTATRTPPSRAHTRTIVALIAIHATHLTRPHNTSFRLYSVIPMTMIVPMMNPMSLPHSYLVMITPQLLMMMANPIDSHHQSTLTKPISSMENMPFPMCLLIMMSRPLRRTLIR
jgi:hypothetical protein